MRLRTRLIIGFALIAFSTCLLGYFALNTYNNVQQEFIPLQEDIIPGAVYMQETKSTLLQLTMLMFRVIDTEDVRDWDVALPLVDQLRMAAAAHTEHERHVGDEEGKVAQDMEARIIHILDLFNQVVTTGDLSEESPVVWALQDQIADAIDELIPILEEHSVEHDIELEQAMAEVWETLSVGNSVVWGVVIFALLFAISTGLYISQIILRPLAKIRQGSERIGAGELDHRIHVRNRDEIGQLADAFNTMAANLQRMVNAERDSKDYLEKKVSEYTAFVEVVSSGNLTPRLTLETNGYKTHEIDAELLLLGENLNDMVESLGTMARQIRNVAAAILAAATEIQAAATQQTASAAEQDAAVTQTVATVEEVRTTVQQTAERAQAVADVSQQSITISRDGANSVANTVEGMQIIQERVEDIAETILMLSERTQQIGEIIDTVNAIADQSKLLALNASIEAARAGEEGKGFAVVALEVRQLAEQSREATARVSSILSEIQQATNTAVMVTEEGSKGAESGMHLVDKAGEAIRDLAGTIEESVQAAMQIAASTHQQTNGMDQLSAAMAQIKQASVQTSATMRQTEQSVHDLIEMARQMENAVARYEL